MLTAISEKDRVYAIPILQWLAFSFRPLSVEEVAEVVAIDVTREPAFDLNEVLTYPLKALDICPGLLIVTAKDGQALTEHSQKIITFAHHSIKRYLVSERIKHGSASKYSIREVDCHTTMAKATLQYLNRFQQPISEESSRVSALARYSAEFWVRHFQKTGDKMEEVGGLAFHLLSSENPAYLTWLRLYDPDNPSRGPDFAADQASIAPPLYYGARLGLITITKSLLSQGADINMQSGRFGSALQAAAAEGHKVIVETLLEAGADVDVSGGEYGNALQAASAEGHDLIVRMLLDRGAKVNVSGGKYGNALQAASARGHGRIVRMLLDAKADIHIAGGKYGSALQAASAGYYDLIVRILLDKNLEIEAQDENEIGESRVATDNMNEDAAKVSRATPASRTAPTDSGYASQRQGESLDSRSIPVTDIQRDVCPKDDQRSHLPNYDEEDAALDDIRSVESDRESIGSKIPTNRSKAELLAIKHLASFFAQLEDLRTLHKTALEKIERRRFTGNYRRILRLYYRRLLREAANDSEKEVTKVLRSRQNRESIAEGIADYLQEIEEEDPRSLANLVAQPAEKQYLENWLSKTEGVRYDRSEKAIQKPVTTDHRVESIDVDQDHNHISDHGSDHDSGHDSGHDGDYHSDHDNRLETGSEAEFEFDPVATFDFDLDAESDDDSISDSEVVYQAVYRDFLNIGRVEKFLLQGSAFRNLILDIRLLMLPGNLREIVETTPKSALRLLAQCDNTWINKTKSSLEMYTGFEWDWWPLAARIPSLGTGGHCLQWKVGDPSHRLRPLVLS